MSKQTYQEVTEVIIKDLKELKKSGVKALDDIDVQDYFYKRKLKSPELYERLNFDTNGHKPFSEDLSSIISDLLICGILYTKYYLIK